MNIISNKKKKILIALIGGFLFLYPSVILSNFLSSSILSKPILKFHIGTQIKGIFDERLSGCFFLMCILLYLGFITYQILQSDLSVMKTETFHLTPTIEVPKPFGEKQFGSAWWRTEKEIGNLLETNTLNLSSSEVQDLSKRGHQDLSKEYKKEKDNPLDFQPFPNSGLVVSQKQTSSSYTSQVITGDVHNFVLGATRSGKTRFLTLPTICNHLLSGVNVFITDIKGEIYHYTHKLAERLGYEIICFDFLNPEKSNSMNDLQQVINYIDEGNMSKAKQEILSITDSLIGENKHGEIMWSEGAKGVLACCIMAVVYDNRLILNKSTGEIVSHKPPYQNLNNVYHFFMRMCRADEKGKMPIEQYLDEVGDTHPAHSMTGASGIAHFKTKTSFYSYALSALRLYEDMNMAYVTSHTDFDIERLGSKKQIIYTIIPEEKSAYYQKASMLIRQLTNILIENARSFGGTLPVRFYFELDEFGNIPRVLDIEKNITLLAGRGLTYNFYIQSISQLEKIYGREITQIIVDNIENWVYLKTTSSATKKLFSERLSNYTTKLPNASASTGKSDSSSTGFSYIQRPLLTESDLGKVERPYQIVSGAGNPMMLQSMNLENSVFNSFLGLGSPKHNTAVYMHRFHQRKSVSIPNPPIWDIAREYSEYYCDVTSYDNYVREVVQKEDDGTEDNWTLNF